MMIVKEVRWNGRPLWSYWPIIGRWIITVIIIVLKAIIRGNVVVDDDIQVVDSGGGGSWLKRCCFRGMTILPIIFFVILALSLLDSPPPPCTMDLHLPLLMQKLQQLGGDCIGKNLPKVRLNWESPQWNCYFDLLSSFSMQPALN